MVYLPTRAARIFPAHAFAAPAASGGVALAPVRRPFAVARVVYPFRTAETAGPQNEAGARPEWLEEDPERWDGLS